jgi:uncharacterized protein (TIGR03437 family)
MKRGLAYTTALTLALSASAGAQPSIRGDGTGVVNASSYLPDIARGSWFVVFGTGLGPASLTVASGLPFPTELAGSRVTFTPAAGGAAIECRLWYTLATQLAALLPSTTAAGDYDVRVIYNGVASAPVRVKVVERNFGFATANSAGYGPAQATNSNLNNGISLVRMSHGSVDYQGRTWQFRPARRGESLVLWGTGLGADPASDVNGGSSGDFTAAAQVRVIVGGVEIVPAYAGRSPGSPGLDQINFTLPVNTPEGCAVPVQVRAGGRLSNVGTLTISPFGIDVCRHPYLTDDHIRALDAGGTVTVGALNLGKAFSQMTVPGMGTVESTTESVGGGFFRFRADQMEALPAGWVMQSGTCYFLRRRGPLDFGLPAPPPVALDAGPQLSLNGPNANNRAVPREAHNVYGVLLYQSGFGGFGGSGSPTLAGGTYTLSGPGGADVRAFTASTLFPSGFAWTNRDAIARIHRGQPLTVTWSGGGTEAGAIVVITGMSGSRVGGTDMEPIYDWGLFTCTSPAASGTFTVPPEATAALAPVAGDMTQGMGLLGLTATNDGQQAGRFGAQLVAGGQAPGVFNYSWALSKNLPVQ